MGRMRAGVEVLLLVSFAAGQSINLSGIIVNQADFAMKGLTVVLVTAGLSATTNDSGVFRLARTVGVEQRAEALVAGVSVEAAGWTVAVRGVTER